nr:SURF1 family protein [Pseudoroseomonas ludipueritiae]
MGLLALLGIIGLVALGTWQVERRAWKLDLIARVDARIHAPPAPLPPRADWPRVTAAADEYRRVQATGTFLYDQETLTQAATALGAGFWVMTPLRMRDGTLLVNRGFVPAGRRDRASRAAAERPGEVTVTGLLRVTEPKGGFLRSNDPAADRWHSRDVEAIAVARELTDVAPFFVDADATPNPGGLPVGGLTVVSFPNSHLVYALTWYALALMLAGAAAYVAREEWRARRHPG